MLATRCVKLDISDEIRYKLCRTQSFAQNLPLVPIGNDPFNMVVIIKPL